MTAIDTVIAELMAGKYSSSPQNLIARVDDMVAALQSINSDFTPISWVPLDASGAGLNLSVAAAVSATRIGNMCFAYGNLTYPLTANGASAQIGGLPFNVGGPSNSIPSIGASFGLGGSLTIFLGPIVGGATFNLTQPFATPVTNATLSQKNLFFNLVYPLS